MATVFICVGLGMLIGIIYAIYEYENFGNDMIVPLVGTGSIIGTIVGVCLALIIGLITNPGADGYNTKIEHYELVSSEVDGVDYYAFLNNSPKVSYQFSYFDDGSLIQNNVEKVELNIVESVKPSVDIKTKNLKDGYIWGFYKGEYVDYYINLPDKELLYIQTGSG